MKRRADKKRGEAVKCKERDLVWVDGANTDRPTKKLLFKRAGPFPVGKRVGSAA